jgi:hypothetical protein
MYLEVLRDEDVPSQVAKQSISISTVDSFLR